MPLRKVGYIILEKIYVISDPEKGKSYPFPELVVNGEKYVCIRDKCYQIVSATGRFVRDDDGRIKLALTSEKRELPMDCCNKRFGGLCSLHGTSMAGRLVECSKSLMPSKSPKTVLKFDKSKELAEKIEDDAHNYP